MIKSFEPTIRSIRFKSTTQTSSATLIQTKENSPTTSPMKSKAISTLCCHSNNDQQQQQQHMISSIQSNHHHHSNSSWESSSSDYQPPLEENKTHHSSSKSFSHVRTKHQQQVTNKSFMKQQQQQHDEPCLLVETSSSVHSTLTTATSTTSHSTTIHEDSAGDRQEETSSSFESSEAAVANASTIATTTTPPHQCLFNSNASTPTTTSCLNSASVHSDSSSLKRIPLNPSFATRVSFTLAHWVQLIGLTALQLTTSPNVIPVSVLGQYLLVLLYSWYFLDWFSFLLVSVTCLVGVFLGRKYIKVFSRENHTVATTLNDERNRLVFCLIIFSIRYYYLSSMKIVIIPLYFVSVMTTTILRRNSVWWSVAPMLFVCSQFLMDITSQFLREGWNERTVHVFTENMSFVIVIFLFTFFTITTGMNLKSKLNKLEQTSEQLEQALSAKQTFLRHISHEFRTPCLSSLGSVELLKETSLTDYQRDLVETIASADGILLNLIEDILTLAKIEHEKKLEEKEEIVDTSKYVQEFSLGHCVKMIGNIIKSYSTQFNVNVLVKIDDVTKDIVVRANQTRIHQIISNLMTNAVKASKSGDDVELICETNCNEKKLVNGVMEQDVIFKVKDRGVGIPKEKQQVIFEPFSQLHNVNESIYPSSGLGLNTVLHNVTSMRGTIHLESEVGKGSEFTITLPLEIVPPSSSSSLHNSPTSSSNDECMKRLSSPCFESHVDIDPSLKKQLTIQENYLKLFATSDRTVVSKNNAQIIIADDNAINRKVIVKLIESLGFETDAVCDGKQLIENIDERRHKLVFTDINMPNLNGLEAAKYIKDKFKDKIHIVALTGDVLLETPPSIFDSVIAKPCRKATLKKCIESIPSLVPCKSAEE
ncbi:hypothetical protein FDP41_006311 [Naegleria fowleri]|uniref:histidine kinase n=1 Tax=Naegleria fowleri TaxID=5763 RepID=A0A6A5BCP7_NAEFO|nr:uncharacterized protein FDP41_006311 [Naegleria fowleri]KAF0974837.1 hypothetical protein FDP41_006311 [Naegleria fowleri]